VRRERGGATRPAPVNVGIYNQPSGTGLGGASYTIAVLAGALARRHRVEIVHHAAPAGGLTVPRLEAFSGVGLDGVRLRYVDRTRTRLRPAELSRGYDLFIALAYGWPPPGHARVNVLRVLFPLRDRDGGPRWRRGVRRIEDALDRVRWRASPRTYQVVVANSDYTREWTPSMLGPVLRSALLAPGAAGGAEREAAPHPERGPIQPGKKQAEMLAAYRALAADGARGWRYASGGSAERSGRGVRYLRVIRALAEGLDVDVRPDVDRPTLRRLRGEASIFWHAAGFGEDLERDPNRAEHFGIVTVEAMAAGCVPVVFDAGGGPREIVEHERTGFRWRTLEELCRYTRLLMTDERVRSRLAAAGQARARTFGRDAFLAGFAGRLAPLLPELGSLAP